MTRFNPICLPAVCAVTSLLVLGLCGCDLKPAVKGPKKLFEIARSEAADKDEVAPLIAKFDKRELPTELREQFVEKDADFPVSERLRIDKPGEQWSIRNDKLEYLLVAEKSGLVASKSLAPPQVVEYVTPATEEVTEYEEFTGRTAATETIELRARVSGYLDKIMFEDGVEVHKGDVLFKIDDRSFVAEEKRTAALIAQYEARIKRLRSQEKRSSELFDKQAISQDEYETVKFDLQEAEATLDASKASHEVAKLNVQFTEVRAPITGTIGRRMVDQGNLVTADVTALATIVPLDKVYVYFDMDERTVLKLRRLENRGMISSAMKEETVVDIALADATDDHFALHGTIDFLDNQIDSATGTLRVRATVNNADGLLSPGLFVRLRYPIGKASPSLLVPEEALASDQGRPFVYVINSDEKVVARPVEVGPQVGSKRVIRSGLAMGERVAVTGLQRLRGNAKVTPKDVTAKNASPKVSEPAEIIADGKQSKKDKAAKPVGHGGGE